MAKQAMAQLERDITSRENRMLLVDFKRKTVHAKCWMLKHAAKGDAASVTCIVGEGGWGAAHHEGALVAALPDQPELQDLGLGLAGLSSLALRHQQLLGIVPPQLTAPSLHRHKTHNA